MRLIDADKLHYIRKLFEDSDRSEVVVFAKEIDKAPTVKAIPIEWIRKWHGIDDIRDCDLREYVKCTMLYMIKDWEKENETN